MTASRPSFSPSGSALPVPVEGAGGGDDPVVKAYDANAEFWVTIARQRLDRYQTELTDPALWQMIGDPAGLDVLDAGSGEGYLTRELTARGARHVFAVDVCEPLTDAAAEHPEVDPATQTYITADVAELPLPANSVDLLVANRIPHALSDPHRRFAEYARVLRPTGRLVLLSLHPCFYAARAERTEGGPMLPAEYFSARTVVQHFNVAGITSPAPSVQRFYSLSDYVTMLTAAGFVITALDEPHPADAQYADPWWQENFRRPLFLLLEARPALGN